MDSKSKLIVTIMRDTSLSPLEKQNRIREINSGSVGKVLVSNGSLTCSHYKTKKCSRFYFPCCDIVDPCVRCHLERDKCDGKTKPRLLSCNECNLYIGNKYI